MSGLSIGVNILRWSIDNGACGITNDLITILVYDPNNPVANAGPDQQLCTPTTSTTLVGSNLIIPAVANVDPGERCGTIANPTAIQHRCQRPGGGGERVPLAGEQRCLPATRSPQDQVSIFVFDNDAAAANAGPDVDVCTPSPA